MREAIDVNIRSYTMSQQQYGAGNSILYPSGIAGWHLVSVNDTDSYENRHVVKKATGHYIVDSMRANGAKSTIQEVWEPDGDASGTVRITIGKTDTLVAVDNASLACDGSSRPRLTVNGHKHGDQYSDSEHQEGSYDIEFAMPQTMYGAVNPFSGATFSQLQGWEIQSSSQTASMNHQDETGIDGKFLVGKSVGVKLESSMQICTAATIAKAENNGGWIIHSVAGAATQDGFRKYTVTGEMYIDESSGASGRGISSPSSGGSSGATGSEAPEDGEPEDGAEPTDGGAVEGEPSGGDQVEGEYPAIPDDE